MSSKRRVAPTHQIISDFRESNQRISIAGSWHLERALLQILVASHAHSGSRAFHGKRYVDTTENDIVQALGYDLQTERRMRQNWINAVQRYADAALEGNAPPFAVDIDTGLPLFGIGLFRWLRVNPAELLTGLLLGGMRDLPEYRKRAQDRYDITIGYGRTHPVCLDRMAAVGLDAALARRRIDQLSGGQMRRVVLAGLLARRPRVLILDEPLAGLDVASQRNLVRLLVDLRRETGLTVVVISHDFVGLEELCPRIVHLDDGVQRLHAPESASAGELS